MMITTVDINAKHRYRTIRFGILYIEGRGFWKFLEDFLLNIGRFEEYDPDVSREETIEESSDS